MKRNAMVWICALLTLSSVFAFPTDDAGASTAGAISEGRLTPRAVTLIYNVYDLQNMSKDLSGSYELANDIDASETSGWNKRTGFAPVGNVTTIFNGTFDGRGFKINNLYIDRSGADCIGLFGRTGLPSRIDNVSLMRVSIDGDSGVGALVGMNFGTITNCSSTGSVKGVSFSGGLVGVSVDSTISKSYCTASVYGENYTGGLVGCAINGTILECYSKSSVSGTSASGGLLGTCERTTISKSHSLGAVNGEYFNTGGLVGGIVNSAISDSFSTASVTGPYCVGGFLGSSSNGTVSDCYYSGTVNGKVLTGGLVGISFKSTISRSYSLGTANGVYNVAGGLAGNISDSAISNCYSTALVACPNYTAGIAGQCSNSTISNSYSTGAVNGKNMTGGLVGTLSTKSVILNCYSAGSVTGTTWVGGLVGAKEGTVTVTSSYWDRQSSGLAVSAAGTAKTTAEMMKKATFSNWRFNDTWGLFETHTYPFLLCFYDPPTIMAYGEPSTMEDAPVSMQFKASRSQYPLDGNELHWSFDTDAAGWLSFNSTTRHLSGTPDNADVGVYRANLSATDDLNYTCWYNFTVRVDNVLPVFTKLPPSNNTTLEQDQIWSFDVDFDDEGVGNTSFGLVQAPAWISIDRTGVISGRPGHNDMGNYSVTLFADDGWGGRINHTFEIVVISDNTPPTITTQDILTATQGIPYSVKYQATDVDPEDTTFLWALATNATWLSMHSSTGILSGTPGAADVGSWDVNVTVVDARGGRDSHDFVLAVLRTNHPPVITTAAIPSATKGIQYFFNLTATDPDAGDVLSWSLNTTAGWLSIDANTGALSGTPGESDVGSFAVNITVKDQAGASDSVAYTIRVLTVNRPPVWVSAPGDMSITEGQRFLFTMQANDPDGDPVQYLVSSQPACGISIDLALGELGWQSPVVGEYELNVSAAAGQFTIYHAFVLKVKGIVTNNPPTIRAVANATAKVGQAFSLKLNGSDPDSWDAGNLTFRLVAGPAGMVVSAEGSILWIPSKDEVGKQNVTVRLSDGKDSTTVTFNVTVSPATASGQSGVPTGASLAWLVLIPLICYALRRHWHQK